MKRIFVVFVILMMAFMGATAHAACTQAIPTQFKSMLFGGAFQKSHTYKIAFYQTAATWDATTTQYAATNEITGTNYSAGGYTLDSFTVAVSGTTAYIDFADEVAATVTFNQASTCAIIYDDTLANSSCTGADDPWDCCTGASAGTCTDAAVYVGTFTSVQPSAGTLTVTFPTADASNAIVRLAKILYERLSSPWISEAEAANRIDALVELKGMSFNAIAGGEVRK